MKRITALITVLLMLAASSAFAAVTPEVPAYLNGTSTVKTTVMYYSGFGLNATTAIGTAPDGLSFFNSTKGNGVAWNATQLNWAPGVANFTGQVSWTNSSNASIAHPYSDYSINATFNTALNSINGLTAVAGRLSANTTNSMFNKTVYYVPVGGHTAMFGLTNASLNSTMAEQLKGVKSNTRFTSNKDGLSFASMFVNGTFDGISSDSDVWDYYAYGVNRINSEPVVIIGQVKITADSGDGKASVKYAIYNGTRTYNTNDWITYNATGIDAKNSLAITRDGSMSLLQNSTINVDENLIIGNVNTISALNPCTLYVVMVKNAEALNTSDLKGHAFRQVYVGSGTSKNLGNATAGLAQYSLNEDLKIAGDGVFFDSTLGHGYNVALDGYTVALANTDQFGLSQSNMTTANTAGTNIGSFYGKQAADKTFSVGIYETLSPTTRSYSLAFVIPAAASTGPVVAANAAYQNNSTLTLHGLDLNSTGYTQTQLRTTWSSLPSDFTPLTDVKGFNATITEDQQDDIAYFTFQFAFDGIGDQVDNLRLYKLFPTVDKTVREYNYASAPAPGTDGAWWISTAVGDGYVNSESYLAPETTYYVNYVVKDNGSYDYKTTLKQFGDPVVLGSVPDDSSSSSGCVFNPAAGFGLEWLLLMLAPLVAVVRSRFKK